MTDLSVNKRCWTVKPIFAWYDLWVGVFIDRAKRRVYIFPLPCIGVVIEHPRHYRIKRDEGRAAA